MPNKPSSSHVRPLRSKQIPSQEEHSNHTGSNTGMTSRTKKESGVGPQEEEEEEEEVRMLRPLHERAAEVDEVFERELAALLLSSNRAPPGPPPTSQVRFPDGLYHLPSYWEPSTKRRVSYLSDHRLSVCYLRLVCMAVVRLALLPPGSDRHRLVGSHDAEGTILLYYTDFFSI